MHRAICFLLFTAVASAQNYIISTLAGGAPPVTPADAATVSIGDPPRVALDSAGNLYFGSQHVLYKVDTRGTLIRIAGTGRAGLAGDGGAALSAQLNYPVGVAVDPSGNVLYAEREGAVLRRVSTNGTISPFTVAGLVSPMGMIFDAAGNLYIADMGANVILKVASNGAVTTVAGNGSANFTGDGGSALAASLNGPEGIALDAAGNLYIADTFNNRVRMVAPDGAISTVAGNGKSGFAGDGEKATAAMLFLPTDVSVDSSGNLYIADLGNSRIRKVANGVITTIAGNSGGLPPRDGLSATAVRLSGPTGIAIDASGALYVAEGSIGSGSGLDLGVYRVWKVAGGKITTAAGTGLRSFSGDDGPAALAQFDKPAGMAFDAKGNLYIADSGNHRVRRITPDGVVTTVAGNALPGFSGDNGPAISAELNTPTDVAVDFNGNLFIADSGNNRVRMVFPSGRIGTLAGNGNTAFFGDGGSSVQAALNHPRGVAVDTDGSVYIADTGNGCIRRVVSGIIDTVASGLRTPVGVAVDDAFAIWVADVGDGTIRKFFKGGSLSAPLAGARGIAVDPLQNVFAAGADRVVKVASDGSLTTIAGAGLCCYSGDGGPAAAARLNAPWGLAADAQGNVYIADSGNDAIRVASASTSTFFIRSVVNGASNEAGTVAPGEIVTIYGAGLGPASLIAADPSGGALPAEIAGARVLVNGVAAPLLYASAGQISAIIPYATTGTSASIVVQNGNASTQPFVAGLTLTAPAIFTADSTGSGQARALNADGSPNGPGHGALAGTPLTIFATGEGQTTPAGSDGKVNGSPAPQPVASLRVTIGGRDVEVQSASGVPGSPAGLLQVTVLAPTGVSGQLPVVLIVGAASSQSGVTVTIQ